MKQILDPIQGPLAQNSWVEKLTWTMALNICTERVQSIENTVREMVDEDRIK